MNRDAVDTARPLDIVSSMATRELLEALVARYAAETGREVRARAAGGVDVAKRVQGGEAVDVVVHEYETKFDTEKFFLHIDYAGCGGFFTFYEIHGLDQELVERYFAGEVERKRKRDGGAVRLTLSHRVAFDIDDTHQWSRRDVYLPLSADAVRRAFPSDKWAVVDGNAERGVVTGHQPELDGFIECFAFTAESVENGTP